MGHAMSRSPQVFDLQVGHGGPRGDAFLVHGNTSRELHQVGERAHGDRDKVGGVIGFPVHGRAADRIKRKRARLPLSAIRTYCVARPSICV